MMTAAPPTTTKPLASTLPSGSSAKMRLRPEDQPRPSKATFPTRWKQKAGPKVRRPLETAASQYRVQVSQFLPGADETRQPRDGETRQRAMHEPPCL